MDEDDEELAELWPPSYLAGHGGAGSRQRQRRDDRLRAHVERHRERGQVPRRARSLSREEIVRAAIAVADAEGADAISMRRIARELDAGTMSLYWHVSAREELLDLMLDAIDGEMDYPESSGDWRADLATIARETRAALLRHRWVMDFMAGRPPMGPNALRNAERALAALDGLGLSKRRAIDTLMTLTTYVMGVVLRELQEMRRDRDRERQFAGLADVEVKEIITGYTERLRSSGRFPRLVAMIDAGVDPDAAETRDERFEFGLACVLDGIAARLAGCRDRPTR